MAANNNISLSLTPDAVAVLDAVASAHGLRGRSEAVRHICAALASTYACAPVQVLASRGRPSRSALFERRQALLRIEALRPLSPGPVKSDWLAWYNDGRRPSPESIAAVLPIWGADAVRAMLAMSGGVDV